jgi:nucleoside-diphosphate-sugar epimerase
MRVVVTGASGNLGTSVLAALGRDPRVAEVVAVARRTPEGAGRGAAKVRWVGADVARDDLDGAFAGADAVIHLAWVLNPSRDRAELRRINVDGSERVFAAALRAGASAIVHASSLGVYAPGPKDRLVDESWPTDGIPGFSYSEDKVAVERHLDGLEAAHPDVRVVRMRPVLVLKRGAAAHLRREQIGAWLPGSLVRPERLPLVPRHPRLRGQVLHTSDVARAFAAALRGEVRGPLNLAADPVVDGTSFAARTGARTVPVPVWPVRVLHQAAHLVRIVPSEPGWTDEALLSPLLDAGRARRELGWTPEVDALDALLEFLQGLRDGAGEPTPPLDPASSGPLRANEFLTSAGARGPVDP